MKDTNAHQDIKFYEVFYIATFNAEWLLVVGGDFQLFLSLWLSQNTNIWESVTMNESN